MDDRIVRIGTLGEFTAEVRALHPVLDISVEPRRPMVRLHLLDRLANGHGLPTKVLELHLQGLNDSGEILWLMESHQITWLPDRGPATPRDQSIPAGTYGATNRCFACATWSRLIWRDWATRYAAATMASIRTSSPFGGSSNASGGARQGTTSNRSSP